MKTVYANPQRKITNWQVINMIYASYSKTYTSKTVEKPHISRSPMLA